jgi:hypothetical protein
LDFLTLKPWKIKLIPNIYFFRFLNWKICPETKVSNSKLSTNQSDIEEDVLTERNRVRNKVGKSEVDVLEIVGLTKIFSSVSSQKKIVAVDDVTLGIHRGEVRILKHFLF